MPIKTATKTLDNHMHMTPSVMVVIVSYNTAKLTLESVASAFASEGVKLHVVIVDNQSSDKTLNLLRRKYGAKADKQVWKAWQEALHKREKIEKFPSIKVDVTAVTECFTAEVGTHRLTILPSARNLGFGRANNLAAAWSEDDAVLFLNSDAFVKPDTIANQYRHFLNNDREISTSVLARMRRKLDNIGIIGATLYNQNGTLQLQGGALPTLGNIARWITFIDDVPFLGDWNTYQHHDSDMRGLHSKKLAPVGWVGGTALMISQPCLQEIGCFDGEIFMYGEDIDLCWRATLRHWDVVIAADAKVTHIGSASAGHKNAIHGEIKGLLYMWAKYRTPFETTLLRLILRFGISLRVLIFGILRRYGQQRIYKEALELVR